MRAATLRPGPGLAAGTDGGSGAILAVPSPGGGSGGRSRRPPPRWRPRSPLRSHPAFRRTPNPLTTPLPNTFVFLDQMTLGWPSPAPAHRWRPPSLSAAAAPRPRRGGWPQEGALAAGRGGARAVAGGWPAGRCAVPSPRLFAAWCPWPRSPLGRARTRTEDRARGAPLPAPTFPCSLPRAPICSPRPAPAQPAPRCALTAVPRVTGVTGVTRLPGFPGSVQV